MMATAVVAAREPGLYAGVSFEEYFSWPFANNSLLQVFERSAAHARLKMLSPERETKALEFGHKFHLAVLEPERYAMETAPALTIPRRKNVDKAAHAAYLEANAGKYIITEKERVTIEAMQAAVYAHPTARAIVEATGQNEVGIVWDDEKTGIRCKARTDMLREWVEYPWVWDLKTTDDASPRELSKDIYNFKYHEQAALYVDGLAALGQDGIRYGLLVVEKTPPYGVVTRELDDVTLNIGRQAYRSNLAKYAECMKTNEWPGYPEALDYTGVPHWAMKGYSDGD